METLVLTADRQPFARPPSLTEPDRPEAVPSRQPPPRAGGRADVPGAVGRQVRASDPPTMLPTGSRWPVLAPLALQSPPTVRLIRRVTASFDEALYLSLGRKELAHATPGGPEPHFATYVSGTRVVYPLVSAVAADTGRLCAARLASPAMTLGATAALPGITRRLFGPRAAFLAAALLAGLSGTQFLGALAAHGGVALAPLALGTWLAVLLGSRAGCEADARAAQAAVPALATAATYASALFDPVVLGLAIRAVWRGRGAAAAVRAGAIITGGLTALLARGPLAGGAGYVRDVGSTSLERRTGAYSGAHPLPLGAKWLWAVALLAALGAPATVTSRSGRQFALLVGVLAAAVMPAAAELARIQTSLFDRGRWLGCAAAGHAVAARPSVVPPIEAATAFGAGMAPAVLPAILPANSECGSPVATAWPAAMRPVMAADRGPLLSDNSDDRLHFYLRRDAAGVPVDGTFYIRDTGPGDTHPRTGLAGYADAIRHGYFCVILPELVGNLYVHGQIERFVSLSARYRLINSFPRAAPGGPRDYLIWLGKGAR
jgi:hypothetical protein